jgi:hypothetical protein
MNALRWNDLNYKPAKAVRRTFANDFFNEFNRLPQIAAT